MTVPQRFARALRRLPDDRRGNVAIIAALAAIPMMVGIGGAVDWSSAYRARSAVQSAADAASLAAVAYTGTDETVRKKDADLIFAQNAKGVTVSNTALTLERQNYVYSADYTTENNFLRLIHIDSFTGTIKAAATTANSPIDIVLVLDSSGSMAWDEKDNHPVANNRMKALKDSVALFLDTFKTKDTTKVALVPFDSQVRATKELLGSATSVVPNPFSSANCSDVDDPLDRQACLDNKNKLPAQVDCSKMVDSGDIRFCNPNASGFKSGTSNVYTYGNYLYYYTAYTDGNTYTLNRQKGPGYCYYFGCYWTSGHSSDNIFTVTTSGITAATTKDNASETANNNLLFSGDWPKCFIDRSQPYDVQSNAMTLSNKATTYPEAGCARSQLQPVSSLSDDLSAINTAVQQMQPNGNTNITIGVQWGMEAMTPSYPLTGARTDPKVRKVMIVLTDGVNSQNRWVGGDKRDQINTRTLLACTNAKAMGMDVYTIRLITGDDALLRSCASKPDMFHPVTAASQLSSVFKELAVSVKGVRLVF